VKIAICEADTPTPTRDAGSRSVTDLVAGFGELGHDVRLFLEAEQGLPARVAAFKPDVIVISRPGLFARLHSVMRPLGVPLIYFAHDLHFVRVGLQQEFARRSNGDVGSVMRIVERVCFEGADLSLVPTEDEARRVRDEFPTARCMAINYFSMRVAEARTAISSDRRIVFVGSSAHAPNADGVAWFAREVWPTIRERHTSSELIVAGVWQRDDPVFALPGIRRAGELSDDELDSLLAGSWAGIAPLRFGAGMKRKTLHYLSLGLPIVGTSFAIEGLTTESSPVVPGLVLASTPEEWMDAIDSLDDDARWTDLSAAGVDFVSSNFSPSRYRAGLENALSRLGIVEKSWTSPAD
jgi:glycosyltransferase involved in cell wall biosynthesis